MRLVTRQCCVCATMPALSLGTSHAALPLGTSHEKAVVEYLHRAQMRWDEVPVTDDAWSARESATSCCCYSCLLAQAAPWHGPVLIV